LADSADYRSTTNLPQTEFPMKANLPAREPLLLKHWKEIRLSERIVSETQGTPFILHDGPPYANGHIHQGHMLNKVLKDFVSKYASMSGHPCEYIPGWDCHGLPIELAVDKLLGPKKREMDKVAIRRECRAYAQKYIDLQSEEFQRLGVFGRWDRPYMTMSHGYEAEIVRQLARVVRQGGVYRGKKPVYWCPRDRTALAESEIEYEEHDSPSIYVGFPLEGDLGTLVPKAKGRPTQLAIWTTTPWTLPSNLAIAVHPKFTYVAYELRGTITLVARDRLVPFLAAVAPEELTSKDPASAALAHPERMLGSIEGAALEGLTYKHPLLERISKVVLAEHVTLEAGTGLVHTAPGHGHEDYAVGLKYGLEPFAPIDDAGRFTAEAPPWTGKTVFEANGPIVDALVAAKALLNKPGETVRHSYPHCWRCKQPVIFRATEQWFISMEHGQLRERALNEIDHEIKWIPAWGKERIRAMVASRPDWCISRQRAWGVPIPAFYCGACKEGLLDPDVLDSIADRFEREGSDIWFQLSAAELLPKNQRCARCGAQEFSKEGDILDVWFDSGTSYAAVFKKEQIPVDMYLEGSDQHRGFFHSTLLCALASGLPHSPYQSCLTHGFVVDGQGRKLSKSLGNYLEPDKLIAQNGAEIVRLWAAAEDYRDDIRLSDEIVKRVTDAYRKLRNTLRYALANLYDFDPAKDRVAADKLLPLDRYYRARLHRWLGSAREGYERYEYHSVVRGALDFCTVELSATYFDALKDRLYCSAPGDPERRSAQTVLHEIADVACRVLATILTFTCEEAYGYLPGHRESVFLAGIPAVDVGAFDEGFENGQMAPLLALRKQVLEKLEPLRREKKIGSSAEASLKVWVADEVLRRELGVGSGRLPGLTELLMVSQVDLLPAPPTDAPISDGFAVTVDAARGVRCDRCWNYREDTAPGPAGGQLCGRCRGVLARLG